MQKLSTPKQETHLGALRGKFSSQQSSLPFQILSNGNVYVAAPPHGVIGGKDIGNSYLLCA
jgi:hypothetical protein